MKNNYISKKEKLNSNKNLGFLTICFVLLLSINLKAQVVVTGSTGANATYTTLKAAFDAINTNTNQTGNTIVISLTGNTTETASAVLNQPSGGAWTTLTISPSGGVAVTITGSLSFPLIGLNGADNVTIDGLNSGGNSLTISNTSTNGTGASTLVFYADAITNTIQNCTILGSSKAVGLATIGFSTGAATGNDGNTITGCTIGAAGTNLPYNAIYSAGTSTTVDNSGITITNNNIQDYFSTTTASNGILVGSNSSAWTISRNRFFQTATRTSTAGSTHRAINIITASGGGYAINNNKIGFALAAGTGVTTYAGNFANRYVGIELTAAATPVSDIQGDTIAGITLTTTSGATTAPGIFAGISVLAGAVNIGTTTGNLIGSATGTGSISVTTTTSLPYFTGIYARSTNTVGIQNNTIASILTGGTASIGYTFHGINTSGTGGTFNIVNNTIGSFTANSITVGISGTTTTGVCKFNGITNVSKGTISITGNTIQNCSSFGTGASQFNGIVIDSAAAAGTLTVTTNNIIAGSNSGTAAFTGIINRSSSGIIDINNNILRNNIILSALGGFNGIVNSGAVSSAINIKNNQLGNQTGGLISYNGSANSDTLFGIANTNGATTAALVITGNDFRGIVYSVLGSGENDYILNKYATNSQNISSNTFTNLNVNTTGNVNFISNNVALPAATSSVAASSNSIVTAFNKGGGGGTVFLYFTTLLPSSVAGSTKVESNNNFSNISLTGATAMSGWADLEGAVGGGSVKTISGNKFTNWTVGSGAVIALQTNYSGTGTVISNDTISNILGSGPIQGINIAAGNGGTESVTGCNINTLVTTGGFAVSGIASSGGTSGSIQNISKNKIFDLQANNATGTVNGILITSGVTQNISNNLIGGLIAPVSTGTSDMIRGISILSTAANSTTNVYYNSVYLNATSTGANFSTSGIFHTASTTSTTSALNLRNNVIVNLSTPSGTGLTVSYRRSLGTAGNLANYASTSNNNLFYSGTPGATRLIYSDGTGTAQTLLAYSSGAFTAGTIAPRDGASVTENPTFLSTTGSNANFLHINTTFATQIESGAVNVATYTDDFDANVRQGNGGYAGTGTAPDIGADEFNGISNDLTAPAISYVPLNNTSCLTTDTLIATITDGSGVNTNNGTKPRIWFKKKSNLNALPATNTNTTNGWKYVETVSTASPFTLVIDYTLIFGGAVAGDTIQYFVVAQDIVTTPNTGINSGTFAVMPAGVALTATAFPIGGTINNYKLVTGLTGTVTVGTGGTYTTLTGPSGLFAAINAGGLTGNVTANILSNITETGANALNSIAYGCASSFTLLIKPGTGVTATLTGTTASALIKLNGADFVTFDGSNSGGTSRDLTITNTNTGTSSAVIWLGSASATDGATNNTIKNCIIKGNAPTTTLAGIISSSGTTIGAVAESANSNNTYQNNAINTAAYGIGVVGPASGEAGAVLLSNQIGSATAANKLGFRGLFISNQTNVAVSNNTIFGITTSTSSTVSGIIVVGAISGGTINGNKISDIKNTNTVGWGSDGIALVSSSTAANLTVSNNFIYDVASYGYSGDAITDNGYGIILQDGGGYNIYYNSVSMNTQQTDTSGQPAALNITLGITNPSSLNIRDNIFANSQTSGSHRLSVICEAANTVFTKMDYNDYSSGSAPVLGIFAGNNVVNLAAWKTATGKDTNSISVAPIFTSATDLHLVVANNCGIDHRGTPIAGIVNDIDNTARDVNFPDIGADEFVNPAPLLSSTLTPPSICSGSAFTYTPTSITPGATFAWARATTAGITQPGAAGTAGVNETLSNTTNAPINVTYVYTTSVAPCSNIQNVVVTVNPTPSLSSTLTPPTICSGSAFSYTPTTTATSPTFTWTRAAVTGITQPAATGSGSVNEVLTNTSGSTLNVTYVFIVTANGCTNAPGQSVVVAVSPVAGLSSSLTPTVCSGTTFNYTPTSSTSGATFSWTRATVNGINEPGTAGTGGVSETLTNSTTGVVSVTYVYTTNSTGCTAGTQNVVVTVNPLPTVGLAAFPTPYCITVAPFSLTGGTPAGGTYAGTGVSAGTFSPSVAGVGTQAITYTVTASGCSNAASQIITVQSCVGIAENAFSENVEMYPNPTSGIFKVTIANANFRELLISIVDIQGKEVYKTIDSSIPRGAEYNREINLKGIAKGIYYIKFNTGADVQIQKLIVQ